MSCWENFTTRNFVEICFLKWSRFFQFFRDTPTQNIFQLSRDVDGDKKLRRVLMPKGGYGKAV